MKKVLIFIITIWLVVYNNSIMFDNIPSYSYLHLPIPKYFRFIEIAIISIIYIFSCFKVQDEKIKKINYLILTFLAFAFMGVLFSFHLDYLYYQIISIYLLMSPLMIFVSFSVVGIDSKDVEKVLKFYLFYVLLNAVIALCINIPLYWAIDVDYVNALFSNAHVFGSFMGITCVAAYYKYLNNKKLNLLFLSVFTFAVSLFSSNEKVLGLNVVFIFIMTFQNYNKHKSKITKVINTGLLVLVASIILLNVDAILSFTGITFRLFDIVKTVDLSEFGFVRAWGIMYGVISKNIFTMMFGTGAANYASAGAQSAFQAGINNYVAQNFWEEMTLTAFNAAFQIRFNFFTNILAEYGLLGFILFFSIIYRVVGGIYHSQKNRLDDRIIKFILVFVFSIFTLTGILIAGEWYMQILSYPAMFLTAYLFFGKEKSELIEA